MNVQSLLAALVDLLQPVVDHPLVFSLAIVIVTAFGVPAKRLLAAVGTVAHVPARFARSELEPALSRTHPWTLGRLLGKLRSYFGPVFDRPARAVGGAIGRTARLIARATAWPIDRITGLILRFVDPFLHELSELLDPIAARASAGSGAALAALSTDGRWVGWRVIGGLLFFVGLCLFLFADAALAIASHEKAVGVAVAFLPDWLKEVTLAYAVASFLSALMLGLVVFDLAGMTHLGPWNELTGRRRSWLAGIVIATACVSLVLATFLSLWRASVILPDFIPADTARTLEGWALTLPIPLLLIATALIGWGAIAMPWILWIVVTAIGSFVLSLLSTLLRVLAVVLPTVVAFLGEVLRILGILGLCVAIGLLCVTLAAVFVGISIALAEILVLGAVGVALWAAAWLVGMIVVAVLDLVAAIVDGLVGFAQHIIHALMYPGAGIWNWVASFDLSHRWHLRPIPMGTTGRSDRDDEDDARAKPVAA